MKTLHLIAAIVAGALFVESIASGHHWWALFDLVLLIGNAWFYVNE